MNEIQEMFLSNIRLLIDSAKKRAKEFGDDYVSIVYINDAVKQLKKKRVNKRNKAAFKVQKELFKTYNVLVNYCATEAIEKHSKGVSFDFLENCYPLIKNGMEEGIKESKGKKS